MMKKLYFLLLLIWASSCFDPSISNVKKDKYFIIEGNTMGTYYKITHSYPGIDQHSIDSLLIHINQSLSTYIPESEISIFNKSPNGGTFDRGYFEKNYTIAKRFYELSGGLYDPTVMPLVNYWGFGYTGKEAVKKIDSLSIRQMRAYVGMEKLNTKIVEDSFLVIKSHPDIELDFSSVAKGFAVDELARYLINQGVKNYLVDIGGEMSMEGHNPKNKIWSIGINTPLENAALTESITYVQLSGNSIATSGNYRNFYDSNGVRISHTINPVTGFPERNNLLSATIIDRTCAEADAWATCCMVSGLEQSRKLLESNPEIAACLIYNKNGELAVEYHNNFENHLLR